MLNICIFLKKKIEIGHLFEFGNQQYIPNGSFYKLSFSLININLTTYFILSNNNIIHI